MRSFKQHMVITEGADAAAKEMEFALVGAAQGTGKKEYPSLRPYALKKYPHPKGEKATAKEKKSYGPKAVNNLATLILKNAKIKSPNGGKMTVSAKVNKTKSPGLEQGWKGRNTTPKTDIVINKMKISLKTGAAQIMSGGIDESMSTFLVAAEIALKPKIAKIAKQVETEIENLQASYRSKQQGGIDIQKYGGNVYKDSKKGKALEKAVAGDKSAAAKKIQIWLDDPKKTGEISYNGITVFKISTTVKKKGTKGYGELDKDSILNAANEKNKKLTESFTELFKDKDFKREFTFEAMTGAVKFGGNEGTADHFLVVGYDGSAKLNQVNSSSDSYVSKILSQVSPNVKFKTGSVTTVKDGKTGNYRFRSVVGLMYDAADNTKNEINNMMNSGELEYLSEGFFDFVSKAWKKFKSFVRNLIGKVKDFITKSVNNMIEFFDIEPKISFRNNIKW